MQTFTVHHSQCKHHTTNHLAGASFLCPSCLPCHHDLFLCLCRLSCPYPYHLDHSPYLFLYFCHLCHNLDRFPCHQMDATPIYPSPSPWLRRHLLICRHLKFSTPCPEHFPHSPKHRSYA